MIAPVEAVASLVNSDSNAPQLGPRPAVSGVTKISNGLRIAVSKAGRQFKFQKGHSLALPVRGSPS